jgi:acylphosphatase
MPPYWSENLQQGLICCYLQVTGEAQGEQSALSQFVQHLNKGPPAARVSTVDHSDIATKEGEKGFSE